MGMVKIKSFILLLIGLFIILASSAYSRTLMIEGSPACDVAFSKDGRFVAGANIEGDVVVWQMSPLKEVYTNKTGARATGVTLSFSDDSKYLAIGVGDQAQIYSTSNWKLNGNPIILQGELNTVAFSPFGNYLVTADKHLARIFSGPNWGGISQIEHPRNVINIAFSSDGRYLAVAGNDDTVHIKKIPSFEEFASIRLGERIVSLAISPYSNLIALGGKSTIKIFELETQREIKSTSDGTPVYSLSFTTYGDYLASGSDKGVVILSKEKNWGVHSCEYTNSPVTSIEFSLANNDLGMVGSDMRSDEITILDTTRLKLVINKKSETNEVAAKTPVPTEPKPVKKADEIVSLPDLNMRNFIFIIADTRRESFITWKKSFIGSCDNLFSVNVSLFRKLNLDGFVYVLNLNSESEEERTFIYNLQKNLMMETGKPFVGILKIPSIKSENGWKPDIINIKYSEILVKLPEIKSGYQVINDSSQYYGTESIKAFGREDFNYLIQQLGAKTQSYNPTLAGQIIGNIMDVNGNIITFDLSSKDGVSVNTGGKIFHPLTNKLTGNSINVPIGKFVVTETGSDFSRGKIVEIGIGWKVVKGDKVELLANSR